MSIDRRNFLAASMAAGVGASVAGAAEITGKFNPKAELKVSSQEGIIPGKSLPERLERMEEWGFAGIEFGGRGLPGRVEEIQSALKNSSIKVSAICAGYQGVAISEDKKVRRQMVDTAKEILAAAGAIGSTGLIMVPAFNKQTKLGHVEGRKILCDMLPELGDAAQAAGTRMLLEPLNRQEAWFLRMLADGASICRDVNHPAVCMMGDFYHMYLEETSDLGAFVSAGDYLHHVHVACIERNLPGQDARDYRPGFRGLKMIGYTDYCSYECGVLGDKMVEIPKSVKVLQQHWKEALM